MRMGGEQGFEGRGGDLGLGPKSHEKARQGGTMTPFILEEGREEVGSGGEGSGCGGGEERTGSGPIDVELAGFTDGLNVAG